MGFEEKDQNVKDWINSYAEKHFGKSTEECIKNKKCVICGEPATEFRDQLSKKEFGISAICQKCQDGIF